MVVGAGGRAGLSAVHTYFFSAKNDTHTVPVVENNRSQGFPVGQSRVTFIKKNKMAKHTNVKANDGDTERAVSPVDRFDLPGIFFFFFFSFSNGKY